MHSLDFNAKVTNQNPNTCHHSPVFSTLLAQKSEIPPLAIGTKTYIYAKKAYEKELERVNFRIDADEITFSVADAIVRAKKSRSKDFKKGNNEQFVPVNSYIQENNKSAP